MSYVDSEDQLIMKNEGGVNAGMLQCIAKLAVTCYDEGVGDFHEVMYMLQEGSEMEIPKCILRLMEIAQNAKFNKK